VNVLIIDDSKMNIKVAKDSLLEYHVVEQINTCLSGEEALRYLDEESVDLILLDIIMPGISGVDLLRIFNKKNILLQTKVIMLTTVDDYLVLKECFDLGATDYIHKPFNKIEFTARVKSVLSEIESENKLNKALLLLEKQNLELMRINSTLENTQGYLIEKEKQTAIGELISGLMSELVLPLNRVESHIDSLMDIIRSDAFINNREDYQNTAYTKIKDAEENIGKISKLVTNLNDFTKRNNEETYSCIDINQLIEEVLFIMQHEFAGNIVIKKEYSENLEISCNKGQIKQAIMNILLNAVNAMEDVTIPMIEIKTFASDHTLFCVIKDNGVGMDKNALMRIFEPFYTTKPMQLHKGLGMTIAHDIITNKHHGQIDVESEIGNGTVITLVFLKCEN